jgi:MFS transporter, SP family, sugar:H+ symporter
MPVSCGLGEGPGFSSPIQQGRQNIALVQVCTRSDNSARVLSSVHQNSGPFVEGKKIRSADTPAGLLQLVSVESHTHVLAAADHFESHTQATPLYLSEMAPFKMRGALNIMFQLAVTIGILAAQLINYGTINIAGYGWRISLALGGVPALMLFVGSIFLPDTPNSLVNRGLEDEGRAVLQRVRGCNDVDVEFEDIQDAVHVARSVKNPYRTILKRQYRPQLVISVLIPMFQQFTGINAIMFYAPQMFEAVGQSSDDALLSTVITGSVNVAATLVALALVDRLGRRFLFMAGGIQMIVCEVIAGVLIKYNFEASSTNDHMAAAIIAFICIYVAAFAWSWGPLGWLVPSEIHPIETRAAGTGITTFTNFIFTFVIGQAFLSMLCAMQWGVFLFFAGFVVIMTLFIWFCVPETKGVPVEEVNQYIITKHWLWSKVVAGHVEYSEDNVAGVKADSVAETKQASLTAFPVDTHSQSNSPRASS